MGMSPVCGITFDFAMGGMLLTTWLRWEALGHEVGMASVTGGALGSCQCGILLWQECWKRMSGLLAMHA